MSIKGFSVGGNVERYDYNSLDNLPSEITIDTALSGSSTNPVQNRVVTSAINSANGSISSISGDVDDLKSALNTKAPVIVNNASGAIASFADGADNMPIKALTVNVEPIQAGSGDPSPENVRPISGRTSATVTRTGRNLFDPTYRTNLSQNIRLYYNSTGFLLKANTAYTFSVSSPSAQNAIHEIGGSQLTVNYGKTSITYTPTQDVYVWFDAYYTRNYPVPSGGTAAVNCQIELGSTATDYEPYAGNTYTIQLGDTVYGGTLDVATGLLTVDRVGVDLGALTWTYRNDGIFTTPIINGMNYVYLPNWLCSMYSIGRTTNYAGWKLRNNQIGFLEGGSLVICMNTAYTDAASFTAAMNGQTLVYELATPQTYQLTGQQLKTLLGTNNVWSDAGDVSVDYRADTKLYIDNIHHPTDDDMTADAQIASGKYFLIGGNLYKSTTVIPAGDTIIPGTNCIKTNLAEALNALNA